MCPHEILGQAVWAKKKKIGVVLTWHIRHPKAILHMPLVPSTSAKLWPDMFMLLQQFYQYITYTCPKYLLLVVTSWYVYFVILQLRNTWSIVLIWWKLMCTGNFEWLPGPLRPPLAVWGLTPWGRDKMAVISQTTLMNAFSFNESVWISTEISPNFVPKCSIYNIPALVQIMARHRPGDKPLSEPMIFCSLAHICVTRPQWVNELISDFGLLSA